MIRYQIIKENLLLKYLDNQPAKKEEIYYWLIDLRIKISFYTGKKLINEVDSKYLDLIDQYITKALRRKLGLKDAINYVQYNTEIEIKNEDQLDFLSISQKEKYFLKQVIRYMKSTKSTH